MSSISKASKKTLVGDKKLLVSDLDQFFKNVYEYYYHRGYKNIMVQTILDNLSYLFCLHFFVLNVYIINWKVVISTCIETGNCDLELMDYIDLDFNKSIYFILGYSLLILYYSIFLYNSVINVYNMKYTKGIYETKLRIRQKDMENMKFDDIIGRLIELQKADNYCRIKEKINKFDIIARITRRENFMIGLMSTGAVDFRVGVPGVGTVNFYTNYIETKFNEAILGSFFQRGDANLNTTMYNVRYFQFRIITYIVIEIIFLFPILFYKLIFWLFKNADNIKSNRNILQRIWSPQIQILFRNYNELQHHYENRINNSYIHTEKFLCCFRERLISNISKFFTLIFGSFLLVIFILSTIDNRLLTDLKVLGKSFVWVGFVVSVLLSIFSEKQQNHEENYIENVELKENLLKQITASVINIPDTWKKDHNFSSLFKRISIDYKFSLQTMMKELLSIILFPFIGLRVIYRASDIIKFFRINSRKVEGLGTICAYSYFDLSAYKALKEKDMSYNEVTFNDRKFINSYLLYDKMYKEHGNVDDTGSVGSDMIYIENEEKVEHVLEDRLFGIYLKELGFKVYKIELCFRIKR
jgi:autophagy-related protein 9